MPKTLTPGFPDSEPASGFHPGRVEGMTGNVIALATEYEAGFEVTAHSHSRAQLLHVRSGVVLFATDRGRWIVPPGHAMWIPPRITHAVEMIGPAAMHSLYVAPGIVAGLPGDLRVVALTDLARSLLAEAVLATPVPRPHGRARKILDLLISEIPALEEQPLALPFPTEARLATLCRTFIDSPSAHATIDDWSRRAGMSRRSFTRSFARQTGLSFSTWRQQALLFAALPRLTAGEAVTGVAMDLGYDSVPAFTTMFRRMLGRSPRTYVRRNGETPPRRSGVRRDRRSPT